MRRRIAVLDDRLIETAGHAHNATEAGQRTRPVVLVAELTGAAVALVEHLDCFVALPSHRQDSAGITERHRLAVEPPGRCNTDGDAADRVAGQVRGLGRKVRTSQADLAGPAAAAAVVAAVVAAVAAEFGRLDILIGNAGVRVVNISSGVSGTPLAGIALYPAAKAFLEQVTKVAAVEFAERRITVNAVGPGARGPDRSGS